MRSHPFWTACAVAAFALAIPSRAGAYERQWQAGASFGYAALFGSGTLNGFGGGLHLTYGLTDAFNAMARVEMTAYPGAGGVYVGSATAGVGYVVDILRWVPYIGAMAGPADVLSLGAACPAVGAASCHLGARLDLSIPFGLDYQISRSFAVGAEGRYQLLLFGDQTFNLLGVFARAEYVWGF
jgi:hypothetical protein